MVRSILPLLIVILITKYSFSFRLKGAKFPGLDSLAPCEERFDRHIPYRYYRLEKTTTTLTTASVTWIHQIPKNMELKMKDLKCSGEDPIIIFDCFSRLVDEADVLDMLEGQYSV